MKLQIVDDKGAVVTVPTYGPLEVAFVDAVVTAVAAYPIGVFRTKAQVQYAIRRGLVDVFRTLKAQTRYVR